MRQRESSPTAVTAGLGFLNVCCEAAHIQIAVLPPFSDIFYDGYWLLQIRKLRMVDNNGAISEKPNKRPAWTRIVDVALRTAHVLVISVLFGGAVFKIPAYQLLRWQYLAIATGSALIASEVFHSRHWPYQGRGIMVFIHAGLFSLFCFRPELAIVCLFAALVFGMVGSHMPKKLRHWSFIHWRVKE